MIDVVRLVAEEKEFASAIGGISSQGHDGLVTGVSGSARHLYYAAVYEILKRRSPNGSLLIVTHTMNQAEVIWDDLREYLRDETVLLFPERELSMADVVASSPDVTVDRLRVLEHVSRGQSAIIVATLASVVQPVMARTIYQHSLLKFALGEEVDLQAKVGELLEGGYERVDSVEKKGQFSVRGGILDVFPMTGTIPYRIELYDTEVDSIRTFDVVTQRSLDKTDQVEVGPAFDFLVPKADLLKAAEVVSLHLEQRVRTITDLDIRDRLQSSVGEDVRRLQSGLPFAGILRYEQLFVSRLSSLFDYLVSNTSTICLDEPSRLLERQKGMEREVQEFITSSLLRGEMLSGTIAEPRFHLVYEHRGLGGVQFSMFARPSGARMSFVLNVVSKTMQNFHGQMNVLKSEIARWERSGTRLVMLAGTDERAERMERVLADYRMDSRRDAALAGTSVPVIRVGNLSAGFELPMLHLAMIVETEVFSSRKKGRRLRQEMSDAERIKSYQELHIGDFVVHINHGIGKYTGIRTLEIDGKHKDYLHLQYAGNDTLYVPVDQIDQVQRYVGSEDKLPKLYHLGGGEWARVKQKVSRTVRDIAEDLVKLYASRQSAPGHKFAPDTPWQHDFEAMFPYDETPDQLRAIQEIKKDMEKAAPMDRLLCGDVGYGKTEVAIRAAFKSVMDGKQVAVLVPTTVLAHQHLETFRERFAGFPVTIEVLSRFRSRSESQAVVAGLKDGSIDVVIGTHRLLQKSVQFKDLGLLIVDEEQRFGVTHKERLKQMRTNVDCLTLTATPIPRTLHMSLLGVRDLSVIETPPENRYPVQTYVVEYNDSLVREALERELGRGGQVYFLYNHVNGILSMADRVQRLVPDARVAVAHGQMAEDQLERAMLDFLEGDVDILVTTTIIETGLDIPNVNTLIVYDGDRLGLSQLYQLRGRVGRSNRIAYAYFTYQKDKILTEVAEKRLQAIKEFTELGSGFKIAMRDLSIRGAGNLLGAEQHGFINSVGFDMYNDMLAKAVKDIRGEQEQVVAEPAMELPIEAYLPESFVTDPAQRIAMYKKLKYVHSQSGADDLEEELEDRYGDLPEPVRNLLDITRMKSYAVQYGMESITQQGVYTFVRIPRLAAARINHSLLSVLAKQHGGRYDTYPNGIQAEFRTKEWSDRELCRRMVGFLADYSKVLKTTEEVEEFAK